MKIISRLGLFVLFVAILGTSSAGCGAEKSSSEVPPSIKNTYAKSDLRASFGEKLKSSQRLMDYLRTARKLNEEGRYQDALVQYQKADELASDRATKTMVNQGFAETYSLLRDYQKAALYFEKAADSTMNAKRAKEFGQKAFELRQINRTPSEKP